jgi:hypothetical protein
MLEMVGESDSFDLDFTHRGVEREIKNYCQWEIEEATYTNKLLNGTGTRTLKLGVRNVTALIRVSRGVTAAINIKHSTAASNAYAKVNESSNAPVSLGLVVADGSAVSSTTELFSTYSTMTLLVAQINTRSGSGWSAQLDDSDYGIFASTNLIPTQNVYAGTWDGTDPGWTDLMMPDEPLTGYELNENIGSITIPGGWPSGTKNIPASFTAGWTTANMPDDLKQAVAQTIKYFYTKHQQGTTGIKSFSLGHLRIEYVTEMSETGSSSIPIEALDVLDADYKASVLL